MPDQFGNPLPTDFSSSFSNDTSLGSLFNTPSSNTFGAESVDFSNIPSVQPTQQEGMFSNFFSNNKGGAGWGTAALGAATGLAQTFMGFNQLSEGRKQNRIAQNQWQQQFDIQKGEYDRRVAERADRNALASASKAKAKLGG